MYIKIKVSNRTEGSQFTTELNGTSLVVGRNSCDLKLNDRFCSKLHAMFYMDRHHVLHVRDLDSRNATRVNGWKVSSSPIRIGDKIVVGRSVLTVVEYWPHDKKVNETANVPTYDLSDESETVALSPKEVSRYGLDEWAAFIMQLPAL